MRLVGRLLVVTALIAGASLPAAAGAPIQATPGTVGIEQLSTLGCGSVVGVALVTAKSSCPVKTLRANNPGAIVLAYMKGETCQGRDCPAKVADPEYAHDASGARIPGIDPSTYLMQIDNQTWKNHVLTKCDGFVRSGWDGCFLDMMGLGSYLRSLAIRIPGSIPPAAYSGAAWAALATTFYAFVQRGVPAGTHLVANGLATPQCAVNPGCPAYASTYPSNGLVVENGPTTDFGAGMELFPCLPVGEAPSLCITATEVSLIHTLMTQYLIGTEHLLIVDHQRGLFDHDTALALFLLADRDPVHTYWAYCSSIVDPACQQPDPEYQAFYARALATGTNSYHWIGDVGFGLYHTTWSTGDCFVDSGVLPMSIVIPGSPGRPAFQLNGKQDTAGQLATLAPNTGQCWSR